MRFVEIGDLKPGMVLAKSIRGNNHQVLLAKGTTLKAGYISNVEKLNCTGLYINDEFSKEIEISDIISDELRAAAVQDMKNIFINLQEDPESNALINTSALSEYLNKIIEEIISSKKVMLNLMDIKSFDLYTYQHSVNVAILSIVMGVGLNMKRKDLHNLGMAALFHDIGKTAIPIEILNKIEPLTAKEVEILQTHPKTGFLIAKERLLFSAHAYVAIMQHHEKYDGTGYPSAKTGDCLLLFSKIISLANVYDAMTSKTFRHESVLPSEALEYIMANSGIHFDPDLVLLFTKKVAAYPLGTTVTLSNGLKGIVVENYAEFNTRPKVKIFTFDSDESYYIDLKDDPNAMSITIVGASK